MWARTHLLWSATFQRLQCQTCSDLPRDLVEGAQMVNKWDIGLGHRSLLCSLLILLRLCTLADEKPTVGAIAYKISLEVRIDLQLLARVVNYFTAAKSYLVGKASVIHSLE